MLSENELIDNINSASREMRKKIITMTYNTGRTGAHIGGGLSLVEIMAVLYLGILKYDIANLETDDRDRLVFSKGHGALALYTAMWKAGILSDDDLMCFKHDESPISAHPSMNAKLGIDFSSGSLGQGLSLAVGVALALKRKKQSDLKVYVILGDGECDEGSIWEAASYASHMKLDNIVVIIDNNGLQYDGRTDDILSMNPMKEKWESFGWDCVTVDGHNTEMLYTELKKNHNMPFVIIADTTKGKGVSFMENNPLWHNGKLSEKQYEQAISEVDM
ncbi:transketolase [uncultured Eubacterium sp.]|uniref:transketolase n=1 Tax=uncultured Eubacterium sp. TaxID=165185 RepID=UPI000E9D0164|nr:transketolase [uncultured Eubacterium sp.]HAV89983.1 transketolase [Eubacterium sp.]